MPSAPGNGSSDAGDSARRACRLCGLPLREDPDAQEAFCCHGCARVYDVLSGLDASAGAGYLAAARALGIVPDGPDSPRETGEPERAPLPDDPSAVREERILVDGLVCPSCAWVVERVMQRQAGVSRCEVDFLSGSSTLGYDLRLTSLDRLSGLLRPLGYGLRSIRDDKRSAASRDLTLAFVVCAILFVNLMSLSALRYFESLGQLDAVPRYLTWVELVLLVPVLWLGWVPALRRTVAGLAARRPTMDLLIAVAVAAAFVLSLTALLTGRDDIYFETCAGLVTISLGSRMIEARLRDRAHADLGALMRLRATRVRVLRDDRDAQYLPIDAIDPGARVLYLAGETVPFDGVIETGEVLVSEAVLTGEPTPIRKVVGDGVSAGAEVVEGELRLEVGRRFDQTRLFRIAESIRDSLARAERSLRSADRIAAWFVPGVLVFAVLVWIGRIALHGLDHALSAEGWFPSVAVLAVACPCAFSLAGVAAITAATGSLLRRGLLVKEPHQLEALARVREIIFDKTGTLTAGRMAVERLVWREVPRPELFGALLAAETGSLHPVAEAIRSYLADHGLKPGEAARAVDDRPGLGRVADLGGGRFVRVGARALFDSVFEPGGSQPRQTPVWFGPDGHALGCFLIGDRVRDEAAGVVERLAGLGHRLSIVSGDGQQVCEWVGDEVGVSEAWGDVSLDEKAERVRARREAGHAIAFVGDGTNDALAMSEATVSVALARSTDEALAASGVVALHGDLNGLPVLFAAGRKLHRVVRSNYVWAFSFNTLFLPVAAAGKLVPLIAMLLMLASSSAVLLNSLRMRR